MGELNLNLPEGILDGTRVMQKIHNNMVFLNDKIWINLLAPDLPYKGQHWEDLTNNILKRWNGLTWDELAGVGSSPTFLGLTINGNIICTGNVDGVDISSHDHTGVAGHGVQIVHANLSTLQGGAVGEYNHLTNAQISALHSAVTVAGAPLTIAGQVITFNYDGNDFQLNGNNLQIKDGGIDHGGLGGLTDDDHTQYLLRQPSADVVINDAHGDFNFRIEGDTNANLFFLDAGLDKICIGGAVPNEILTIDGVLSLKESSAPSASANYGKLYVKTYTGLSPNYINHLWFMDESGTEYDLLLGALVSSVFGRTGDIVATANDYTWAKIDKTVSSIANITTKDHDLLGGLGDDDHTIYILADGTRAFTGDVTIPSTKKLLLSADAGTYFYESADNILDIYAGAVQGITCKIAEVVINEGSVDCDFRVETNALATAFVVDAGAEQISHGVASLFLADMVLTNTKMLRFDGNVAGDTYIYESGANVFDAYVGGTNYIKITHASTKIELLGCNVELDSLKKFYFDGGGDTYISESGGNQLTITAGGIDTISFDPAGISILAALPVYFGNCEIIESANNVLDFYTTGAKALSIDASGRVTQPLQPFCRAWLSNAQNNLQGNAAAGILVNLNDDTTALKGFDVGGNFNTGTHLFTVPVSGTYILSGSVGFNNVVTGYTLIASIQKTNATTCVLTENDYKQISGQTSVILPIAATIMNLTKDDTIGLYCYIVGADSTIDLFNNSEYTFLCVALLN